MKSRFLYRFLKTNNTPIELLWFKFGVLFILEVTAGFEPADNGVADRGLTTWLRHQIFVFFQNAYILYQKPPYLSSPFFKIFILFSLLDSACFL